MGRKPKGARNPSPPPPYDPFEDDLTNDEIDIEDFLAEWAPGTAVVEIYQCMKDGSRPHQERVGIDILRTDLYGYLREHFGAGKYQLQFKDAQRRIRKTLTVDVAAGKPIAPNGGTSNTAFNEQLILALIASNRPPQLPPPIDMGALMTGLAAIMTALKPVAPGTDPAAMLQAVSSTFSNLKSAAGDTDNWMDKVQKLVTIARELNPGEGGGDTWPSLIKDIGGKVLEGLKPGAGAQPNGRPPQIVARPVTVVPTIPAGAMPVHQPVTEEQSVDVPTEDTPDMLREKWLRAQLAFLKQKALAGKDVEFWVDYILENQEEPGNQAILYAMDQGATFQHLLTFDAEIGKNPVLAGWFQQFYESLHAALIEDMDSPGKGGNAPDTPGNAKPSPE